MEDIQYIERKTGDLKTEKVYGASALKLMYGTGFWRRCLQFILLPLLVQFTFVSRFYGFLQKRAASKKKILPFIKMFEMDPSEFLLKPEDFSSFNDFFTRQLKKEARPINSDQSKACFPADARYWFYQDLHNTPHFIVKGKRFSLDKLLGDPSLAARYERGSMVMARLCPTDYHRFHFPCDCTPSTPQVINGALSSVNPIAISQNLNIFTENKRTLTTLETASFGKIAYLAIGATNVGSIIHTYQANQAYKKGDEMGFFSFGGSSLILLFEENTIEIDEDLLDNSYEILALMGQSLGQRR